MRNVFYFWICIAMWLLSACSSQKKEDRGDIQVLMKDSVDANQSSVVRRPDDSLPVVINEQGDKFVDNSITLRITSGGKSIVDKVFTKESFASLVDAKFMKHSILEGLVYDKTTPQGIVYAASVCYPQSDLYIPLSITVSADGKISLAKEELLEDLHETDSI